MKQTLKFVEILTIEDQTEMIKYLRKYNTGKCKNRICFTNVQFPYKLLGTDLGKSGKRQGRRFGATVLRAQILRQALPPTFLLIAPSFLVPHTPKLNLPSPAPVSQPSNGMATSSLAPLVLTQPLRHMQVLPQALPSVQASPGPEQAQTPGLTSTKIKFSTCVNLASVALEVYRRKAPCELS